MIILFHPIGEYNKRFSLQFVNKLYDVDKTRLAEGNICVLHQ
jgi:hypothetical protein